MVISCTLPRLCSALGRFLEHSHPAFSLPDGILQESTETPSESPPAPEMAPRGIHTKLPRADSSAGLAQPLLPSPSLSSCSRGAAVLPLPLGAPRNGSQQLGRAAPIPQPEVPFWSSRAAPGTAQGSSRRAEKEIKTTGKWGSAGELDPVNSADQKISNFLATLRALGANSPPSSAASLDILQIILLSLAPSLLLSSLPELPSSIPPSSPTSVQLLLEVFPTATSQSWVRSSGAGEGNPNSHWGSTSDSAGPGRRRRRME